MAVITILADLVVRSAPTTADPLILSLESAVTAQIASGI